jgi:hypothetical protein
LVGVVSCDLVADLVRAGVLAAGVHCWSRRPGGGWMVEVVPLDADDFCGEGQ